MEHDHTPSDPCTSRCPAYDGPEGLDYQAVLADGSFYECTLCGLLVMRGGIDKHTEWHRDIHSLAQKFRTSLGEGS